jgi:ligand-binding SRPBCC domain-containing protein
LVVKWTLPCSLALLPITRLASIESVTASGFTDRQLSGPFAEWVHRHSFVKVNDNMTEVIDQIALRLKPHFIWGLIGLCFWFGLPVLFAYRGWKTRRLIEQRHT